MTTQWVVSAKCLPQNWTLSRYLISAYLILSSSWPLPVLSWVQGLWQRGNTLMWLLNRPVRVTLSLCHLFTSSSLMGHNEKVGIHQSLKIFPHDSKCMSPLPLLLDHCERDRREPYRGAIIQANDFHTNSKAKITMRTETYIIRKLKWKSNRD